MKILKASAILLIGPLLGLLIAFLVSVIVLSLNSNFATHNGPPAPGDGILILIFGFISLVISVPLSALMAGFVLFRKSKSNNSTQGSD